MPLLRLRTLTRAISSTSPCRRLTTTPVRRFPTVPGQPAPEVYTSKARPSSVHASPESDVGRSYIPRSSTSSSSSSASTPVSSTGSKSTILDAVKEEGAERFDGPARPRMRYERPKEARELPDVPTRWRYYLAVAAFAVLVWSLFLLHVTNAERLSSSVLRQVTYQLRNSEDVKRAIGGGVRYAENWWGFGEPWISGNVNLPQGKVDLKFRIRGDKEGATVYFTSIRPEHNAEFRIVRYKVVTDSGKTLQMPY